MTTQAIIAVAVVAVLVVVVVGVLLTKLSRCRKESENIFASLAVTESNATAESILAEQAESHTVTVPDMVPAQTEEKEPEALPTSEDIVVTAETSGDTLLELRDASGNVVAEKPKTRKKREPKGDSGKKLKETAASKKAEKAARGATKEEKPVAAPKTKKVTKTVTVKTVTTKVTKQSAKPAKQTRTAGSKKGK